jgi:hypothetical protein
VEDIRPYHLFSGSIEDSPQWLEACKDLESAREQMKKRAERAPGHYFIFCHRTQAVLASINTSKSKSAAGARD